MDVKERAAEIASKSFRSPITITILRSARETQTPDTTDAEQNPLSAEGDEEDEGEDTGITGQFRKRSDASGY